MKALDLVPGTPEWHEHRAKAHNASDASALMGNSPYDNYQDLVMRRALGIEQEHDDYTKEVVFKRGHDIEEAIRPVIEADFDTELFPTVATSDDGFLSASFDGITVCETVIWECKQWSEKKVQDVREGRVPPQDYWQVVQQMAVSEASKCIYTISDGEVYEYVEVMDHEVQPDFEVLRNAWKQFDEDVKNYQHTEEAPVQIAEGVAPDTLPALRVEVSGMVTYSTLEPFKKAALAVFNSINTDLKTDEDFANAKKTVKWCKDVEGRLDQVKADALSQTATIDELFSTLDELKETARQARLNLDKQVKHREKAVRDEIKSEYNDEFQRHAADAEERCYPYHIPLRTLSPDFGAAMKGKRSISSIREACKKACMEAKLEVTRVADLICRNAGVIASWPEHQHLFADSQDLVLKDTDDLQTLCKARVVEHEAKEKERLEAERERIRAEEEAKATAKVEIQREEEAQQQAYEEQSTEENYASQHEYMTQSPVSPFVDFNDNTNIKGSKGEPMVEITKSEYIRLKEAEAKLQALEDAGVDNWQWYGDAMEAFYANAPHVSR